MNSLENKIPPPIVTLLFGVIMWLCSVYVPVLDVQVELRVGGAIIVAILGVLFCGSGVISFKMAKTTVNPLKPESASSLVVTGVFKVSRNPMYVGFSLILLGWCVYLSAPFLLALMVLYVAFITRFQIIPEERAMTKLFGEEFEAYQLVVRRWL